MSTEQFTTHSPEETISLGRALAEKLQPPKLVLLRGDLGAGKTTITKGIAAAFDAASEDDVTSPTFTLVHEYRGPRVTVYHIDLYRIETERELYTLGLDDILGDPNNVVLIEWGEKFPDLMPEDRIEIRLRTTGDNSREIEILETPGGPSCSNAG